MNQYYKSIRRYSRLLLSLCIVSLINLNSLKAQYFSELGGEPGDKDAPEWVRLMYSESPNVYTVDQLFKSYYSTHKFVKTSHTQYYKKWRRFVDDYIQADGTLNYDPSAKQIAENKLLSKPIARLKSAANANWLNIGPSDIVNKRMNHVNIFAIDRSLSDRNILYAGLENGGMQRTTNNCSTWEPLINDYRGGSVTSVAIDPVDPNIVYFGSSTGIYKTADAGSTFTLLSDQIKTVHRLVVNPQQRNIILAGASNGFYRSTDSGASWTRINETNGTNTIPIEFVYDIEFKPGNPQVVHCIGNIDASGWNHQINYYKSLDGGATFVKRDEGWFNNVADADYVYRAAQLGVTPANADAVYAFVQGRGTDETHYGGFIYKSTDEGETWSLRNPNSEGLPKGPYSSAFPTLIHYSSFGGGSDYHQGFYNYCFAVSDMDENQIYTGSFHAFRSDNGGQTFTKLDQNQLHLDKQWMLYDNGELLIASDGGIHVSTDSGNNFAQKSVGISATDFWGFDLSWDEKLYVGGRYHNGDIVGYDEFPAGNAVRIGGVEEYTGYAMMNAPNKIYTNRVGGVEISKDINDPILGTFGISSKINEGSTGYKSELEWHPAYGNVFYLGHLNELKKTTDGGNTFETVAAFGESTAKVTEIEVSRSNPDVMYCVQINGGTSSVLHKTADGGKTWSALNLPEVTTTGRMHISLSAESENELWIAFTKGANGEKIYKTNDGGTSWLNLTTNKLDEMVTSDLVHQLGTDGGIYIATNFGIYYRNNSMEDWANYSNGLPSNPRCRALKPFYRDNLMILGSSGYGVFETPMYEKSEVIAQPMLVNGNAERTDKLYFKDFSVMERDGSETYLWEFPGATTVSSTTDRFPEVYYENAGTYDVTLTVSNSSGSSTKTIIGVYTKDVSDADIVTTNINATEDAAVRDGSSATKNFGADEYMDLKSTSVIGYSKECFLKFNIEDINKDNILSAKLKLYCIKIQASRPNQYCNVHVTDNSWVQSTITWDTKPVIGELIKGSMVNNANAWHEVDITDYITGLEGDVSNIAFALQQTLNSDCNLRFATSESTNAPQLEIVYQKAGTATSIDEASETDGLNVRVYPVPLAHGNLNIDIEKAGERAEVQMLDLSGKVLYQQTVSGNGKVTIPHANINYYGIAIVRVVTPKSTYVRKVLIM